MKDKEVEVRESYFLPRTVAPRGETRACADQKCSLLRKQYPSTSGKDKLREPTTGIPGHDKVMHTRLASREGIQFGMTGRRGAASGESTRTHTHLHYPSNIHSRIRQWAR